MGLIRVLPEFIANKISAGEVVERPASIVKELIENALDAGARSIDIVIEHGGKSLIRVADDGCGMDPQDAKLAFGRHATSKITAAADLDQIRSFGFRGEALPSIAAVSRTRLVTRPQGASTGAEAVVEGGSLLAVQEHPCRAGTIVEVRDLFFNTPARRKFLKNDSTELGHIQDLVSHLALSSGQVRFTLKADGKMIFDLPPVENLTPRAAAILGEETAQWLLELEQEKPGIKLWGLIGKPSVTRANRAEIRLFVNRRWVRSLSLSYALQAGYHGLLMHGRFPVAVLFLELDLKRVDVNVHPAKQEVRISNEPEVVDLVKNAVKERLHQAGDLAPQFKLSGPKATQSLQVVRPPLAAATAAVPEKLYRLTPAAPLWGEGTGEGPAKVGAAVALDAPIALRDTLRVTKILGQIHSTFIVAETEEGMLLVDQHAAHERIQFEALLKNFSSGEAERQTLLLEEALELHPRQLELFKKSLPMLERVGFELEPFGERTFLIRAVPAVFGPVHPVRLLTTFLEELEEGKTRTALEDHLELLAALCACKKQSVKARDPLEPLAVRKLLERLGRCENPFTCPHGRPVFFTQSFSEMEKQFKRS
ncbi:MAG: DNA mismatch repair endonuclease MutL [Candidatus Omnitrophica bacterium]|nr:DNA mismatch repair endonuclease MutL [Candidatus Omnitrophota bacterium]